MFVLKLSSGKMTGYTLAESTNLCLILFPKEKNLIKGIFTIVFTSWICHDCQKTCRLFTLYFILYSTNNLSKCL